MPDDHPLDVNRAVPGGRVEMFAIPDDDYPGGWFYRFQYYHPDEGEILRYDNAHDDAASGRTIATSTTARIPRSRFTGSQHTSAGSSTTWPRSPTTPTHDRPRHRPRRLARHVP